MLAAAAVPSAGTLLDFWSSTCTICETETPALASVARAMAGKVT